MKKLIVQGAFLLALGAFAAAQTTPTTTPSNTNSTGTQNPTQVTPVPNPNAPPPPDANTNSSTTTTNPNPTGTATSTGSATPDATTKSGDADQNTAVTPNTSTSTSTTTTTNTNQDATTNSQNTTQASARTRSTKNEAIVGCLESSNNGQFTIRTAKNDVAVSPSSTFTGTFAEHVGHKVRVHGTYAATQTAMNTDASAKLPQSDQPASANGTVQNDNPAKADTRPDTRAADTAADANASAKTRPSASIREFRADSIDMLAKTCGNNNYNNKK